MTKYLIVLFTLLQSPLVHAGINLFKDEHGKTNWQHLANWSSGTLIIILSAVVINLFFTRRRANRSNRELQAIRKELEQRVQERTATLDESNRLLKNEVAQHVVTTNRLRASESYIKDILASMPLLLIGLNKEGQITQWNKRAEEVVGLSAAEALGQNLWKAFPTITISPEQVAQALEQHEIKTIRHSQRSLYHFDITLYPLQEQAETGVVVLIDDVTKKVQAENLLINSDKMASLSELASTMAHDINTPLQAILFDLKVFQKMLATGSLLSNRTATEEEQAKLGSLLADASEKGQDVASIVSNMLNFSRGRSGEKQPSSIPDIMDHTLELAGNVLSAPSGLRFQDIRVEKHYEEGLPLVPCYVTELQQVFLSLLRHCCDAIGQVTRSDYQPLIKIQINQFYDALWIKIQHNGVGLTSEEQMYLFEPFFGNKQAVEDYAPGKRLSFCHFVITEQHQGHIAVTSDVNVGSTFHMELQLK